MTTEGDVTPSTGAGGNRAPFFLPIDGGLPGVPRAAYLTTSSLAAAVERQGVEVQVVTASGTWSPAELRARAVTPATGPEHNGANRPAPLRSSGLLPVLQDLKVYARAGVDGFRFSRAAARAMPATYGPAEFVWQRHALFTRAGPAAARRLRCPLVLSVHAPFVQEAAKWNGGMSGVGRLVDRCVETPLLRRADLVTCVSEEVAALAREAGVPSSRLLVLPNGVDVGAFDIEDDGGVRRDHGLEGRFVIVWTGSFRPFHNALSLVRAAATVPSHASVSLLFIGDGSQRAAVAACADDLSVHAIFTGAVSPDDVPRYLRAADMAVVTAPPPGHGAFHYSPVKLREYLAAGLPVAAPAVGEIARDYVDERELLHFNAEDPTALARAIDRLQTNADLRARLSAGARETSSGRTWDDRAGQLLERVRAIASRRGGPK